VGFGNENVTVLSWGWKIPQFGPIGEYFLFIMSMHFFSSSNKGFKDRKHTDMTIHWKALEEHFLMVTLALEEHFLMLPLVYKLQAYF
jgi:hypothetical protein